MGSRLRSSLANREQDEGECEDVTLKWLLWWRFVAMFWGVRLDCTNTITGNTQHKRQGWVALLRKRRQTTQHMQRRHQTNGKGKSKVGHKVDPTNYWTLPMEKDIKCTARNIGLEIEILKLSTKKELKILETSDEMRILRIC